MNVQDQRVWRSVLILVRSDIVGCAIRTRIPVEVCRRGFPCCRASIDCRGMKLLVIIAGTIRFPTDKCRPQRRVHGDIPGSRIGNGGSPPKAIVGIRVAICVIISHYHSVSGIKHNATLPTDETGVKHHVVDDVSGIEPVENTAVRGGEHKIVGNDSPVRRYQYPPTAARMVDDVIGHYDVGTGRFRKNAIALYGRGTASPATCRRVVDVVDQVGIHRYVMPEPKLRTATGDLDAATTF